MEKCKKSLHNQRRNSNDFVECWGKLKFLNDKKRSRQTNQHKSRKRNTKLNCNAHTHMYRRVQPCVCVWNYTYHRHVYSNKYILSWRCVCAFVGMYLLKLNLLTLACRGWSGGGRVQYF